MTHASAEEVQAVGRRARVASAVLRTLHRDQKDAALRAIADALIEHTAGIIAANDLDVQAAQRAGTDPAIIDRLTLTEQRLSDIAAAVRQVAALPDPVGDVLRGYTLPNGLKSAPGTGSTRCGGHDLRSPPERHRGCSSPVPEER
jgi:glutamate-5-semialdehyde dehydrogenase